MKYIDYMQLNPFQRFGFKFVEFFRLLPKRIKDFFCFIGRSIKNFFVGGAIVNLIGLVAVYNQIPIAGPGNRFNDVLIFNSTQNLLFGILAVMATIAFIAIYFVSIKSALNCERIKRNGGKPMNFK